MLRQIVRGRPFGSISSASAVNRTLRNNTESFGAFRSYSFKTQEQFTANEATSGVNRSDGAITSCGMAKRPRYFDYQATTPLDPRVLDEMLPFFVDLFGNPHSRSHAFGWEAEHFVEKARKEIAELIGAQPKEIIFTSGATESNNMVIKGVAQFHTANKNHMITTQIEHKCVLASCRDIQEKLGWNVTYLPVNTDGLIDPDELETAITPQTALVSVMTVNNEIGVIQPMKSIGDICRKHKVLLHTDGAQACGKIPLNMAECNIDMMSISGHKIYGPKGIGALYIRSTKPRIRLTPLMSGGGQERGLRSGTLPPALVVGLGAACRIAREEMTRDSRHICMLEQRLYNQLTARLPHVVLNGSFTERYRGNLNLSFEAVEGESLLMSLERIALSSGSACTSASLEPSYVLRAIGVGEDLAHTSLRFGFGRFTTVAEVDECAESVVDNVERLRNMSPLWEVRTGEADMSAHKPVWT